MAGFDSSPLVSLPRPSGNPFFNPPWIPGSSAQKWSQFCVPVHPISKAVGLRKGLRRA